MRLPLGDLKITPSSVEHHLAVACYENALHLNSELADIYFNLGNTFKKQEKLDEAAACYQKALTLNSS
jgi:tetratricopeptide (TPR) repeat protein